ncbi:MAG: DUF2341 domain-containing protein, partial [Cyanobacteria bacterium]|nr:DUF2341 domain-containing protein [Cyanobacteriota bacterium]
AFDDNAGNSYAGITDNGTWNFTTAAAAAATVNGWTNSAWGKRLKITVDNTKVNGDLTDFPILLDLNDLSSKNFFGNIRSDGGDIRITQGDGMSLVPTELVSVDTTNNQGELWFKAPALSGTVDTDFYVYYNNNNATMLNADHPLGKHAVWSNGFVAVYHMSEDPNGDTTGVMRNSVANQYHGTPSGTMTSADKVAGQVGNGTDLDGTDDYINVGDITGVDFGSSNFEFTAWAKHDNTANQDHIFGKDSNTNGRQFEFRTDASGGIVFSYWKSGAVQVNKTQATVLSDTNWHLIGALKRGSSFEIYKDGSKIGSGTSTGTHGAMDSTNAPLFFGRREYSGFTEEFDGKLDEMRIANKAHSEDWIETEFNNQNSPGTFYTVAGTVTAVGDDGVPKVSSTYPANRADRFPLAANLYIEFNENVQAGSGNITIKKTSDGSTVEAIAIGSATISGARVTINPTSSLVKGTEYYVVIDNGAIEDTGSTAFTGISSIDGWRFTTEAGKSTINNPNNLFMLGE